MRSRGEVWAYKSAEAIIMRIDTAKAQKRKDSIVEMPCALVLWQSVKKFFMAITCHLLASAAIQDNLSIGTLYLQAKRFGNDGQNGFYIFVVEVSRELAVL